MNMQGMRGTIYGDMGGQTVRMINRVRGKHNTYTETPGAVYHGCAVQPDSTGPGDRNEDGTATEARWALFAPPGFPLQYDGVMTVDGITGDDGQPRRLHVFGELQTHFDLEGFPVYVSGTLTDWRA